MTFDKAAYWKEREAKKNKSLVQVKVARRIVCRRCHGSDGMFIKETFFCRRGCDQNSLWNRIKGFFGLGNWRVIYPDGERSIPMTRRVAQFCRNRAGGVLLHTKAPITFPVTISPCAKHLIGPGGELL